jgi:hypothetical protein
MDLSQYHGAASYVTRTAAQRALSHARGGFRARARPSLPRGLTELRADSRTRSSRREPSPFAEQNSAAHRTLTRRRAARVVKIRGGLGAELRMPVPSSTADRPRTSADKSKKPCLRRRRARVHPTAPRRRSCETALTRVRGGTSSITHRGLRRLARKLKRSLARADDDTPIVDHDEALAAAPLLGLGAHPYDAISTARAVSSVDATRERK